MILEATARLILEDHRRSPITGNVLLLGRQTVPFGEERMRELCAEAGVPVRDVPIERDMTTRCKEPHYISDRTFFAMFTDARVGALDVSAYEGAEFIWDLCDPIPTEIHGNYDYIFDGSCFDNLFDPAEAIINVARLLRVDGRMFLYNHGTMVPGAYIVPGAEWYQRFLQVNGYGDIDVRPYYFDNNNVVASPWDLQPKLGDTDSFIVVRARKMVHSTNNKKPIQGGYVQAHNA